MKTLLTILAVLLHIANRSIKDFMLGDYTTEFYSIKDAILKKYTVISGYDVQHIRGKKCFSCGGTGQHPKYSYHTGKIYDYADCYHCWNGWYKMPKWICLERRKFGKYIFHRPIKREEHLGNPFTKESLGWEVSTNPVIECYIEHEPHRYGMISILILFYIYNPLIAREIFNKQLYWRKDRLKRRVHNLLKWRTYVFWKPKIYIHDDLPF